MPYTRKLEEEISEVKDSKTRLRFYLDQKKYVHLSRNLIWKLGLNATILITEMIDWEEMADNRNLLEPDQSFCMEQRYIEERTGMSPFVQREARAILAKNSLLKWERRGVPPKYYYILNHAEIETLILQEESQRLNDLTFKGKEILPISYIESKSKVQSLTSKSKELRSFNLSVITASTEKPVEAGADDRGLEITPSLIKRTIKSPIVFEKNPRQRYRADVLDIINYWNSSPGLIHHKIPPTINGMMTAPTKTFLNAVSTVEKVIDGKFFTSVGLSGSDRVYTKKEIITSIDRFKLMATNPSYLPADKTYLRHIGLNTFFHNPFSDHIASYFLKCLGEEPKPIITAVVRQKEKNPQLTIWLRDAYRETVLLGIEKEFNPIEENKIIKGANQLHETIRRLQPKLNMLTRPVEWCQMVIDALVERWGKEGIYLGHLASDYTYNDILPRYLKRKGRLG